MNAISQQNQVIAFLEPWSDQITLLIRRVENKYGAVSVAYAAPLKFENVTPETEGIAKPPTIRLTTTEGQELIDRLWACGLRPTEARGSAGQLTAVQEHLSDMQKIAFGLLRESFGEFPNQKKP